MFPIMFQEILVACGVKCQAHPPSWLVVRMKYGSVSFIDETYRLQRRAANGFWLDEEEHQFEGVHDALVWILSLNAEGEDILASVLSGETPISILADWCSDRPLHQQMQPDASVPCRSCYAEAKTTGWDSPICYRCMTSVEVGQILYHEVGGYYGSPRRKVVEGEVIAVDYDRGELTLKGGETVRLWEEMLFEEKKEEEYPEPPKRGRMKGKAKRTSRI